MQSHMREGQELSRMAVQICYEIQELQGSLSALAKSEELDPAYNRTLESVLLHFRNLRGFFIDDPKRDDVSARHYVESWKPNPDLVSVFDETKVNLDKRLSHLTWERLSIPVNWPLDRMQTAINRLFEDFEKALTPPQDQWFCPANIGPKGAELLASNIYATASGPPSKLIEFIKKQ